VWGLSARLSLGKRKGCGLPDPHKGGGVGVCLWQWGVGVNLTRAVKRGGVGWGCVYPAWRLLWKKTNPKHRQPKQTPTTPQRGRPPRRRHNPATRGTRPRPARQPHGPPGSGRPEGPGGRTPAPRPRPAAKTAPGPISRATENGVEKPTLRPCQSHEGPRKGPPKMPPRNCQLALKSRPRPAEPPGLAWRAGAKSPRPGPPEQRPPRPPAPPRTNMRQRPRPDPRPRHTLAAPPIRSPPPHHKCPARASAQIPAPGNGLPPSKERRPAPNPTVTRGHPRLPLVGRRPLAAAPCFQNAPGRWPCRIETPLAPKGWGGPEQICAHWGPTALLVGRCFLSRRPPITARSNKLKTLPTPTTCRPPFTPRPQASNKRFSRTPVDW